MYVFFLKKVTFLIYFFVKIFWCVYLNAYTIIIQAPPILTKAGTPVGLINKF